MNPFPLLRTGVAILLLPVFPIPGGQGAETRFEFTEAHMGVPFRLVLHADSEERARQAARSAFSRIAELDARLSNYDTDSELNLLCTANPIDTWIPVSPDLFRVLSRAQEMAELTGGAFDITVGPVAAAWRHARRTGRHPPPDRLERFLGRVGWRRLKLDPEGPGARLSTGGMRLDPGGIAKGDALDQALEALRRHGITSALVDAGGDIAVSDPPPGRSDWRIALPTTGEAAPEHVRLANRAIATSGDLHQFVILDGVRHSHIVDPRTGLGLTERRLVTVIAPSGILADSLATALSVLGARDAPGLMEHMPDTHCRITTLSEDRPRLRHFGAFESFLLPGD